MSIYALQNSIYKPAMRVVIAITNAFPAQVTTSIDGIVAAPHNYIDGTIVRIDIPTGYGMTQINQLFGPIIVNSPTTFLIDIDTTHFDVFAAPPLWPNSFQKAQCVPIGEINSILTAAVQNVL